MWGFVGSFHIKSTFVLPDKILNCVTKVEFTGPGALQNLDTKWNHRFILLYASAAPIDVKIYSSRLVVELAWTFWYYCKNDGKWLEMCLRWSVFILFLLQPALHGSMLYYSFFI